jgi:hypothetical protein
MIKTQLPTRPAQGTLFTPAGLCLLLGLSTPVWAADGGISREEFLAMKQEMQSLRSEVKALRAEKEANASHGTKPGKASSSEIAALSARLDEVAQTAEASKPGEDKILITGSTSTTFTSAKNDNSNFAATFSPILLWNINDKLFVESEVEFELDGTETGLNLEYVSANYSLNDYMTISAGKFLSPMSAFIERHEAKWINKLPDAPLAIYDGILPEGNVGFQLRGVLPAGPTRFNYAAYVSNAPRLITDDPEAAGQLEFNNYTSLNDHKAVGGRIGFAPLPNLEVGYGIQDSKVSADSGGPSIDALLQAVDFSASAEALNGRFTLLGEYAWSRLGRRSYDVGTGAPVDFDNKRQGGYAQISYRAKQFDSELLNHFEIIARADRLETPDSAPGAFNEKRLTLGLDYWITGSTVFKAAWEFDHRDHGEPNGDAFLFGFATAL